MRSLYNLATHAESNEIKKLIQWGGIPCLMYLVVSKENSMITSIYKQCNLQDKFDIKEIIKVIHTALSSNDKVKMSFPE